jgi:hypothetical protein
MSAMVNIFSWGERWAEWNRKFHNFVHWIRMMLVMLLGVYIHTEQAWKICLTTVGIEPTTFSCSIPTVVRHIFQACPVWIYTQSNITSIMFNEVKQRIICARWGTVQRGTKVFYFVALKFVRFPADHHINILTDYVTWRIFQNTLPVWQTIYIFVKRQDKLSRQPIVAWYIYILTQIMSRIFSW